MKILLLFLSYILSDNLQKKYNVLFSKHTKLKDIKFNFLKKILYKHEQQKLRDELKYELSEILIEISNFNLQELEEAKSAIINYLHMLNNDMNEIELIYIFNVILDKINVSSAIKQSLESNGLSACDFSKESFCYNELKEKIKQQENEISLLQNNLATLAASNKNDEKIQELYDKINAFYNDQSKLSQIDDVKNEVILNIGKEIEDLQKKYANFQDALNSNHSMLNGFNNIFSKYFLFLIANHNDKKLNHKIDDSSKTMLLNFLSNIKNEHILKIYNFYNNQNTEISTHNIFLTIIVLEHVLNTTQNKDERIVIKNTINNIENLLDLNFKNFAIFSNNAKIQEKEKSEKEQAEANKAIQNKENQKIQEKTTKEIDSQIEKESIEIQKTNDASSDSNKNNAKQIDTNKNNDEESNGKDDDKSDDEESDDEDDDDDDEDDDDDDESDDEDDE